MMMIIIIMISLGGVLVEPDGPTEIESSEVFQSVIEQQAGDSRDCFLPDQLDIKASEMLQAVDPTRVGAGGAAARPVDPTRVGAGGAAARPRLPSPTLAAVPSIGAPAPAAQSAPAQQPADGIAAPQATPKRGQRGVRRSQTNAAGSAEADAAGSAGPADGGVAAGAVGDRRRGPGRPPKDLLLEVQGLCTKFADAGEVDPNFWGTEAKTQIKSCGEIESGLKLRLKKQGLELSEAQNIHAHLKAVQAISAIVSVVSKSSLDSPAFCQDPVVYARCNHAITTYTNVPTFTGVTIVTTTARAAIINSTITTTTTSTTSTTLTP